MMIMTGVGRKTGKPTMLLHLTVVELSRIACGDACALPITRLTEVATSNGHKLEELEELLIIATPDDTEEAIVARYAAAGAVPEGANVLDYRVGSPGGN